MLLYSQKINIHIYIYSRHSIFYLIKCNLQLKSRFSWLINDRESSEFVCLSKDYCIRIYSFDSNKLPKCTLYINSHLVKDVFNTIEPGNNFLLQSNKLLIIIFFSINFLSRLE